VRISDVEQASGCSRHTIRFYEAEGLIAKPERDANNYRRYEASVVAELGFIKTAQEIGFTLAEIRAVLEAQRSASLNCLQGAELVDAKLVEIGGRLTRLRTMRSDLEAMRSTLVASALDQGLEVPDRLRRHGPKQVPDVPHVSVR
jgi:MerR family copper efflux transcriptional regulator